MEIEDLKNNPEALKQLIGLLSSLLPNENQDNTDDEKPKKQKRNTAKQTKQTNFKNKKNVSNNTNKFLSMSEKNMFKEDVAIDRLLSKYPPTERARSISKIKVQCRICGKKDTIHPSMLCESVERYKCNNCSTSPG